MARGDTGQEPVEQERPVDSVSREWEVVPVTEPGKPGLGLRPMGLSRDRVS